MRGTGRTGLDWLKKRQNYGPSALLLRPLVQRWSDGGQRLGIDMYLWIFLVFVSSGFFASLHVQYITLPLSCSIKNILIFRICARVGSWMGWNLLYVVSGLKP